VKNTLGMFDLLKGLVMLVMIVGHTKGYFDNIDFLPKYIWAAILGLFGDTAMPMLMVIGGYSFRKTTLKKCVIKQYDTLIKPCFIVALITTPLHFIAYYLLNDFMARAAAKESIRVTIGLLFGAGKAIQFNNYTIPESGPIWFLFAMAVGMIIFNQLTNWFEGEKLVVASVITAIVGWILGLAYSWPWSISQGMVSVLYISMGYFAKKKKLFTSGEHITGIAIISVLLVISFFILKLCGNGCNLAYSIFSFGPFTMIQIGIVSCMIIFWFMRLNKSTNNKFFNSIRYLGRNSLYVLCIHAIEIVAVGRYLQDIAVEQWTGPIWIRNFIVLGSRMLVDLGITYIFVTLKSNGIGKLFGNRKRYIGGIEVE
jgi:hypothetical protein